LIIIDTSVLFDAVVGGLRSDAAKSIIFGTEILLAPDLIRFETANALTRGVRRGDITPVFAQAAFDLACGLVPTESAIGDVSRALELSLDLIHPCADCVFLAFAERRNARLATSDARFARKLAGTPHARRIHLIEA